MRSSPVNIEDKEKLQLKIRNEIQKLSAYTKQESNVPMQNAESDPHVKTEALVTQAVDQHTLAEAKRKIAALRKTLINIHDENFGLCTDCGVTISLERLLIVPDTNKCPDCAA